MAGERWWLAVEDAGRDAGPKPESESKKRRQFFTFSLSNFCFQKPSGEISSGPPGNVSFLLPWYSSKSELIHKHSVKHSGGAHAAYARPAHAEGEFLVGCASPCSCPESGESK